MKLINRTYVLYTFLLFFSIQLLGQNVRAEVAEVVASISKGQQLESARIGVAGMQSSQYRKFKKLRKLATETELLSLLQHESSIVKGYVALALADRKYSDLQSIFNTFLNTKETVKTQKGCIISEDMLASELYFRVLYPHREVIKTTDDKKYYKTQLQQLNYSILRAREDTLLLKFALENNHANPENYTIIKSLALEDANLDALAELAKYQYENDIEVILEKGTKAFEAMSHFPNARFWNFLMQHTTTENSLDYFKAIAAFQNDEAEQSLRRIYKTLVKEKRKGITNLTKAIITFYCPKYRTLSLEIFAETRTIDITQIKRLLKTNPKEATRYFVKGLLSDNENNFLELDSNYGTRDSILSITLKSIKKYQPEKIPEICVYNVDKAKFVQLTMFLEIITKNKVTAAKMPLLARLEKKTYPFERFHITKALLSFEDTSIHREIERILSASRDTWDRGNWSAAFKELFEEYGLRVR